MSRADHALKLVQGGPVYRLQEQIGFLLRKANQRHIAIFAAAAPDLTPPQFAALAMLAEQGEMSQSQLGQLVAMDGATIKGVIDRLNARGLVAVDKDKDDRRRLLVNLTERGRAAVAVLIEQAQAISAETLSPLNETEAETLIRLLGRIG
jgi:DNA-binding MarR family transcriptional regulator